MPDKLTLAEAAAKLNITTDQLKRKVAQGEVQAEGEGDAMRFEAAKLPKTSAKDHVFEIDDEADDDFTLKLEDEAGDTDITSAIAPPPAPGEPPKAPKPQGDTNVFGDDTVDLMDTAGATDTIELTDDSIAGDSFAGVDTLGGSDTLGTDTLMAQDSLASADGQETFLGADILEGLSGDTTAEITSEVRAPDGPPAGVQYVAVREEKSPVTTFLLVFSVIFMVLSLVVFVNGLTATSPIADRLIFSIVRDLMKL